MISLKEQLIWDYNYLMIVDTFGTNKARIFSKDGKPSAEK
jgi:hypothetical protein